MNASSGMATPLENVAASESPLTPERNSFENPPKNAPPPVKVMEYPYTTHTTAISAEGDEHLHQHRERVLGAHHAAVEQRQPRDRHQDDERAWPPSSRWCRPCRPWVPPARLRRPARSPRPPACRRLSMPAAGLSCASAAPAKASEVSRAINANSFFIAVSLQRRRIGLAGADADDFLEIEHEDLAVADLAGVGRLLDRFDRLLEQLGLDGDLDLYLGQEIDDVLRAAVELGVALSGARSPSPR